MTTATTTLADFLLARIAEDEAVARTGFAEDFGDYFTPARALTECDAKRRIVELHKSWPVLVEQRPEFPSPVDGLHDMTFRMTQQIAWATQEEYRKRFGSEPPTAPMLAALALPYADHPDYRPEWRP